jgi:hypothetical protein
MISDGSGCALRESDQRQALALSIRFPGMNYYATLRAERILPTYQLIFRRHAGPFRRPTVSMIARAVLVAS